MHEFVHSDIQVQLPRLIVTGVRGEFVDGYPANLGIRQVDAVRQFITPTHLRAAIAAGKETPHYFIIQVRRGESIC